jgi:hypothetical protein
MGRVASCQLLVARDGAEEAGQDAADFLGKQQNRSGNVRVDELEALGNQHLRLDFLAGTIRNPKVVSELASDAAPLSFGNVRGDRHGRTSKLVCQSVALFRGKRSCESVYLFDQIHCFLPGN